MKKFVLLLFLICPAFAQTVKTTGAWMPVDVKWEQAPPEVNARLEAAQTRVLFFGDGGNLAVIECIVNREPGRYMTISRGMASLFSPASGMGSCLTK